MLETIFKGITNFIPKIIVALISFSISAWFGEILWNNFVPSLIHGPTASFGQILSMIIFGRLIYREIVSDSPAS